MQAYNAYYRDEKFEILLNAKGERAVESSFAFPLGVVPFMNFETNELEMVTIIYIGRVDLFTKNAEGSWSGPDHKTAFMFGEGFQDQMATDPGQKGYCWSFKQFFGYYPKGYIIDAVRIRRPKKADFYAGVAPVDESDFQRIPFYVFPDEIDEWREDTLAKVEQIFWMHSRGYFHRNRRMCTTKYGRCDMFEVCIVPKASRETLLASNLFEPMTWSPLNRATPVKEDA